MRYYLTYKSLLISLLYILIVFPKPCAYSIADNYLWLELDSSFLNNTAIANQEIYIYFGHFPDEKKDMRDLYNLNAFYTIGKKDNHGSEIFYPLEIKKKETGSKIIIDPKIFNWFKLIVTAEEKKGGREYNYCAMLSAFISGNTGQSFREMGESNPQGNFTEAFDVTIYRERIKDDFSVHRKRLFPVRMKIKFNGAAFSDRLITIIDRSGDSQQLRTARNGEFVYVPKDNLNKKQAPQNKMDADLVMMEHGLDNKIYLGSQAIYFTNEVTKKRNFSLPLGLIIFISSFTISFFLLYRSSKL